MNLNQRDKLILIVVLVIVIWVAGVVAFIKPAIDDVNSAKETLNSKEVELADLQKQIDEDKDLPKQAQQAYDKLEDTVSVFYPVQAQHQAMMQVQDLLDLNDDNKQDIQNLDMSISVANTVDLGRYVYNPAIVDTTFDDIIEDEAANADVQIDSLKLGAYFMSFNFTATKEDLMSFFDSLQASSPKSLIIDEVNIGSVGENENSTEWTGEITMEFIMVPAFPSPEDVDKIVTITPAADETADAAAAETEAE